MTITLFIGTVIIVAIAFLEYRSGTIVDLSSLAFLTLKREVDPGKFARFVLYKAIAYETVYVIIVLIVYGHVPFWILRIVADNTRELAILSYVLFFIVFMAILFWIVLRHTKAAGKGNNDQSKPA
jgi:hypothetical protein